MSRLVKSRTVLTGLAMFSMFFGAGNVVFPLMLGHYAGDKSIIAVLGLIITAIIVPFSGLMTMILFEGKYKNFFHRIGKVPGSLLILLTMALIGPFVGIPRCITLSHSTLSFSGLQTPLWLFSLLGCGLIFLTTFRKNRIVSILGTVLTPILLISLLIIIVLGLTTGGGTPVPSPHGTMETFFQGLREGYNTLDLPAAFFFSTVVLTKIRMSKKFDEKSIKKQALTTLKSCLVGASCLILVYIGLSLVASSHGEAFQGVNPDQLLAAIAFRTLGPKAGLIANIAVSLACLTTAIVLSCIFAEFIRDNLFKKRIGYIPCLILTLCIAWCMSELGFMKILHVVAPVVVLCYPLFIVMTYLNLGYKLFDFKPIRLPALIIFLISLILYIAQ